MGVMLDAKGGSESEKGLKPEPSRDVRQVVIRIDAERSGRG